MPIEISEKNIDDFPSEAFIYDKDKTGRKRCRYQDSGEDSLFPNSMNKEKMAQYMREHDGPFYIFMKGEQYPRRISANEDGGFTITEQMTKEKLESIAEEEPPEKPSKPNIFSRMANSIKKAFGGEETDRFKKYHEDMDEYEDQLEEYTAKRKMARDCAKLKDKHDKVLDDLEKKSTSKTKILGDRELANKVSTSPFKWWTEKSANNLIKGLAEKSIKRFNEKLKNLHEGPNIGDRELSATDMKEDLANMIALSVSLVKIKNCKDADSIRTVVGNIENLARTIKANLDLADPKALETDLQRMKSLRPNAIASGNLAKSLANDKFLTKTNANIKNKKESIKKKQNEVEKNKTISKANSKKKNKNKSKNYEIQSNSMTFK